MVWSHTHNVSHESYDLAHTEFLFSSLYLLYIKKKYAAHSRLKQITAVKMQVKQVKEQERYEKKSIIKLHFLYIICPIT